MTHTMIPRTNYLMEQEPSLMQARPVVMEAGTADRTKLAEKKKMGPPGPCSGRSCSRYSMSRTMWASRHDLLVIPRYRG
jgi:hypothetical protein